MIQTITSFQEFEKTAKEKEAVLFYFSHKDCNVCKVLKPKIIELIENNFSKIEIYYCDTVNSPEIAAQNQIFIVPTIMIFFTGKEYIRKSRNLSIEELQNEINRPYGLIFNA